MAKDAERVARNVLEQHAAEIERIKSVLASCINRLKELDLQGWRKEGNDIVDWMQGEANDMANAEKNVAITKASGGSASILGGVMTGVGVVGSFFTFGLAAPVAVAGLGVAGLGAVTSAGGDIAKLSIVHMKTCKIKQRCEGFEQRSEAIVAALAELLAVMTELSELCKKEKTFAVGSDTGIAVVDTVLKSGKAATSLVTAGVNTYKIAAIVYDITVLQRSGLIFGADVVQVMGRSFSKALFNGAGAVVGIGFGIWDVVEASGTLQNGGSHCKLILDNASSLRNTIAGIDQALRQFDL